jgi:ribosomal protein S12 methylthiotransferase accessory factor YcaO
MISTGLCAGRAGEPVVLHGAQEVLERDALVGAWWGAYAVEEHDPARVLACLPSWMAGRLLRPNLRYRFYRIRTPLCAHVTLVSLVGEDHEGFCFSVGSACRQTRRASWEKALLEAVQGRHYIRYLKASGATQERWPTDFAAHAVYYSYHREELAKTVLNHLATAAADPEEPLLEDLATLAERLGPNRPILFRNLTPPALVVERLDWVVLRVLVPGVQPLHGHHGFPFLGGPLWGGRQVTDWQQVPPHPFP